jgi:anaerobic magnesium-protoporphyrin IX monomethyl ester cyclase
MKLLFVNPSLRPTAPHRYLPVGLGYVVTAVKTAGIAFDLLDIDGADYSDNYVESFLAKRRYDVVAVGSIVTHYKWIKWLIAAAKRANPGCHVIVGNSVGSSMPEILFHHTEVDTVILGEGDVTIVALLEALRDGKSLGEMVEPPQPVPHANGDLPPTFQGKGIAGIVFRDAKGRLVNNGLRQAAKKIDDLPWPDWDLFDVATYIERGRSTAHETVHYYAPEEAVVFPVNTARGCVFKCTFCHYVFWNDPYRHRSPESIVGEIRRNQQKYGANYIHFWDELSFHKIGPTEKVLDKLIEADLGVHWTAAVRSDLLGRDDIPYEDRRRVAEKFVQSGCLVLGFSLESGDDEILAAMNKRVKAEYFREQVKLLREVDLISSTSLVFGYPQETPETIARTMRLCEELNVYPSAGMLLPFPATGMWKHAIDHGFIKDPEEFLLNMTERQDLNINMTTMSDEVYLGTIKQGLQELNEKFGTGLSADSLLKTGGYAKHDKNQIAQAIRHRNTTDSLSYAKVAGAV